MEMAVEITRAIGAPSPHPPPHTRRKQRQAALSQHAYARDLGGAGGWEKQQGQMLRGGPGGVGGCRAFQHYFSNYGTHTGPQSTKHK